MHKNKKTRLKNMKIGYIIAFIVIFVLVFLGSFYKNNNKVSSYVVEAEDISETILFMKEKSAINMALEYEKELIKAEEERQAKLEEKRKQEELEEQKKEEQKKEEQKKEKVEKSQQENKGKHEEKNVSEEGSKIAYLTFDDGPSKVTTPQILDILDHYKIKATFFVIGNLAEKNPDLLKRTYEEGHAIGNHTYSHRYDYIYEKTSNLLDELEVTEKIFKDILGEEYETNIMRFPGGSFGDKKAPFREAVEAEGYEYVDWNSLNGDAEGYDISEDKLIQRFKSTFKGQEDLVILMHDTDAKETTPEALPEIIDFLIQQGYEFHTLE